MLSKEEKIREENEKISYLRKKTGRGVFQCRKALSKNEWNVDKATKWLSQFGDSHFYMEYKEYVEEQKKQQAKQNKVTYY